ncbi:N-acetylmuramoyl-L-alanine amidase family protein [Oribacterium sp. WCC10]|uniref:N-acetylmuramoyl-L-alanine amidase family protein n=1 Tax=Oribacterium sp. WCC10 TaxID=1855343 RepID=UPI0008EF2599|nr:hypothetical protein [Oribacterium sp. WCC10]SFG12789.1 Putative cell wall binding repeat-containing protein [Oribacterium sp. WCC10]
MRKNIVKYLGICSVMSFFSTITAFAMVKNVVINANLDNINEPDAGICFFPEYEVDKDDDVDDVIISNPTSIKNNNPTIPATINVTITSDVGALDDDLKITGTGIRSTYVDVVSVDNTEASGRLLVYPLYELPAPDVTIDPANSQVKWNDVDYSGKYEVVITYLDKNGNEKTSHHTTEKTYYSINNALNNAYNGQFGVAVRAIPTDDQGYQEAVIDASGKASWTNFDSTFAEEYEVRISYTNVGGKKVTKKFRTKEKSHDVSGYINSAQAGTLKVTVRAIPKRNDASYYNISISDWAYAGSYSADVSDYDVDDKWDFLGDYKSTVDGEFATNVKSNGTYNSVAKSTLGSGDTNAFWKRTTYKWQYIVDGVPFNQGWRQINGNWYYFDTDSYMHTGWLQLNGAWYYLESKVGASTGVMYTGTHQINGRTYEFGSDGICINY